MRRLYSDYCITLGDSVRRKKKYPNSDWLKGHNGGQLSYIESIYCSIFNIDSTSKEGKSFRRNLRKRAKKSDLYKKYSKL
ncbi:MAG: hypothetical protein NC310_01975 [Roseburia sp.]|nr:hypothetical protein [Roseburia sp.]MCM1556293.1 hypothetical protein [Anaeroplasma bactoclasticum]